MKKAIHIPDIGDYKNVDIIEIMVSAGDTVEIDTPLLSLETEKAVMDVPSPFSGVITSVTAKVGDKVSKGDVVAEIEANKDESSGTEDIKDEEQTEEKPTPIQTSSQSPMSAPQVMGSHAGPGVRRFARELGVDLSQVFGRGRKNRILKQDVQGYVSQRLATPGSGMPEDFIAPVPKVDFSKQGEIEKTPLSRIQKISGKNLHRNWVLIPHVTHFDEADITELEAYRKENKEKAKKQGVRLTALAFLMKAVVETLKQFPTFNASLDDKNENLILKKYYHIGFAADTPKGLVVPVVKNVNEKSLLDVAKELGDLSALAREGKLKAEQMQGGCFTISSLGGIGGSAFTPIINMPEVAILGVSRSKQTPVYTDEKFEPRLMLPMSLSYDHRVIDGAQAARMMRALALQIEDFKSFIE